MFYKVFPRTRDTGELLLMVGGMTYAEIHNFGPHRSSDTTSMVSFTLRTHSWNNKY
jgi:hypothetical protein